MKPILWHSLYEAWFNRNIKRESLCIRLLTLNWVAKVRRTWFKFWNDASLILCDQLAMIPKEHISFNSAQALTHCGLVKVFKFMLRHGCNPYHGGRYIFHSEQKDLLWDCITSDQRGLSLLCGSHFGNVWPLASNYAETMGTQKSLIVCMLMVFITEQVVAHYNSIIMGAMASQITSLTIVYSTVYLGTDQRKCQSSESLAFVRGIHRSPVNSPHKGPVTRKIFHLMTSSWINQITGNNKTRQLGIQ